MAVSRTTQKYKKKQKNIRVWNPSHLFNFLGAITPDVPEAVDDASVSA